LIRVLRAHAGMAAKEKTSPREHATPTKGVMLVAFRRTLRDFVQIIDTAIDFGGNVFHIGMKILGPCLICLALGLISFVTYTFFVHALPLMNGHGLLGQCALTLTGLFLVSNALYNYGRTICTPPGEPPEFTEELELSMEADTPKPRKCGQCGRSKPQRTHHCSVCRKCVLKMDHHCPWVNNCIGFMNYRYFCLFMMFLGLSCLFIVVTFGYSFGPAILLRFSGMRHIPRASRQCLMTSFMVCVSIVCALCMLGGFHMYLVLTNQTTIEFQTNLMKRRTARKNGEFYRNPYDLGRSRNFQAVFGPNPFCKLRWALSWWAEGPSGDGADFPSLRVRGI